MEGDGRARCVLGRFRHGAAPPYLGVPPAGIYDVQIAARVLGSERFPPGAPEEFWAFASQKRERSRSDWSRGPLTRGR
jgi:ribonuclease D